MSLVLNYVDLMLEYTETKNIDKIVSGIDSFIKIIESTNFQHYINNKSNDKTDKKALVSMICNELNLSFFEKIFFTIIDFNKTEKLLEILKLYKKHTEKNLNHLFVNIYSPFALSTKNIDEIISILTKRFNKKIYYNFEIDKDLIGGVVIKGNDFIIDKSIRGQIASLSNELIGGSNE
ncbi:MAG: hypothetical protein Ta2E_04360 [Mycoplasmoidaceae bacterium]|nr:MAG: hypothetical protein Ta2E_04360 [Mycoplasmoidaceae bacterium]